MLDETMKLVLGWTIVVAFIATAALTLASLVGLVKFAYPKQQQGLYVALILELVLGTVSGATGRARYDPSAVADDVRLEGRRAEVLDQIAERLDSTGEGTSAADREELLRLVDRLEVKPETPQEQQRAKLRSSIEDLPAGQINAESAKAIRKSEPLKDVRPLRRHTS